MDVTVRIVGLEELKKKLDGKLLVQPEMQDAVKTITDRIALRDRNILKSGLQGRSRFERASASASRGRKGLGIANNPLAVSMSALGTASEITSPLNWPRTTGSSWTKKNIGIFKSMVPNVIRKAIKGIESRWAA